MVFFVYLILVFRSCRRTNYGISLVLDFVNFFRVLKILYSIRVCFQRRISSILRRSDEFYVLSGVFQVINNRSNVARIFVSVFLFSRQFLFGEYQFRSLYRWR